MVTAQCRLKKFFFWKSYEFLWFNMGSMLNRFCVLVVKFCLLVVWYGGNSQRNSCGVMNLVVSTQHILRSTFRLLVLFQQPVWTLFLFVLFRITFCSIFWRENFSFSFQSFILQIFAISWILKATWV